MENNICIANNFWKRLKGLMFKEDLKSNEAMVLLNTKRVHSSFMKFNIGVIYLDRTFNVVDYEVLKPWKVGKRVKGVEHIVEVSEDINPEDGFIKEIVQTLEERENGRFF